MSQLINIDQFGKIDLRVGEIVECEKVEGADKLLKLRVNLGTEPRQLVAGLAGYYEPDKLIGKQIVVVCNLQPAVIRGVKSEGMLLAVKDDDTLGVLIPERRVKNGSKVS